MTTLLVLLVLLIGGGLYGGWQYVQGQYYVGVQDGNVAIFRGVNQNLAGISLSSLIQRTTLPITQVVASNQGMIRQTIPSGSLGDAQKHRAADPGRGQQVPSEMAGAAALADR